jgi:hypothetical protein
MLAATALAAMTFAGCGSQAAHPAATVPTVTAPSQRPVPAATVSTLRREHLRSGEEPGFTVGRGQLISTLTAWVADSGGSASQAGADTAFLRRQGFVAGVFAPLGDAATGVNGSASVTELGSPTAAAADRDHLMQTGIAQTGRTGSVTLNGVSGASGYTANGSTGPIVSVFWTEGRCTFTLGNEGTGVSTAAVITAVRAVVSRTDDRCP